MPRQRALDDEDGTIVTVSAPTPPALLHRRPRTDQRLPSAAPQAPTLIEIPFQSASALEAPPRVNVGQFVGAGAVAPAASARSRSQWCRLHRPVLVVGALPFASLREGRLT